MLCIYCDSLHHKSEVIKKHTNNENSTAADRLEHVNYATKMKV